VTFELPLWALPYQFSYSPFIWGLHPLFWGISIPYGYLVVGKMGGLMGRKSG